MLSRRLALASTCLFLACQGSQKAEEPEPPKLDSEVSAALERLNEEFRREVYEVTDRVYQAVGFGIANSIMVEGDDCVFIVDVMGSVETATEVKAEFDKITQKPIEALIYTHNHADHVMGGLGFVPDGKIDVYAQETTNYYINRFANVLRPALRTRSARMFGSQLRGSGPDQMENVGLGPFVETLDPDMTLGLIRPNKTFWDELSTEICGVKVELVDAPGETNDQLFVWLPERGVLLPGDNIYKAFPNLYSIRGTLYRDVLTWAYSIDKMRALRPMHLVPSHTRAISGQDEVYETLTAYRDAIQFVHDQTIRGINRGLTPDELVEVVKQVNANARNYYLTQALELEGKVEIRDETKPENALSFVSTVPIGRFVAAMPANLIYEKAADKEILVGIRFPDVGEGYGIHIRRGVAEFIGSFPEDPDLSITADSTDWREIVLGLQSPAKAFATGKVRYTGSTLDLLGFLRLFQRAID